MTITVLTLFPEIFTPVLASSIIGRAEKQNLVHFNIVNIRTYATDKHKSVDDTPYGGGNGMILRVDILDRALSDIKNTSASKNLRVILLDPQGSRFNEHAAVRLSSYDHLILLSGHYEGIDERTRSLVDEEISIGDFILTGGEIPAMAVIDSVVRLLPGVLGKNGVTENESFSLTSEETHATLLEYPHYTKPQSFKGMNVPEILLSGHRKNIESWRKEQSLARTKERRPDLLNTRLTGGQAES